MRFLLPFCRGVPQRCFYQDYHRGIGDALHELGHETALFEFADLQRLPPAKAQALYQLVTLAPPDAVIDIACWGYELSRITVPVRHAIKEPIFDAFGVLYSALLCDQPHNQALNGIVSNRLYAGYPDTGHPDQVRLAFPGLRLAGEFFLPPGVRPENDHSATRWASDRNIDVLYVGNLHHKSLQRYWNEPTNALWHRSLDGAFCDALADDALAEPERSLHLGALRVLERLGPTPSPSYVNFQLGAVEIFLRHQFRYQAVMALARSGVRMRVVGKGWDRIPLPGTVDHAAPTDYDGLFALAAKARICLDASTYLDGVNDRVFAYALNRAVCFTNAAGYLSRIVSAGDGLYFYSMRRLADLCEQVKLLLARPLALREAGERAHEMVLAAHTWRHRITELLQATGLRPSSSCPSVIGAGF